MNENKTAIEHVDKWLREKMKGEEVRGLRYEALLDCLQQVEFRAEEEARALESSQTEKDKGCASWDSTYGCMKRLPIAPKPEAKTEEGFVDGYKQCKCGSSSAYMNIHKVPCCGGCGAPLEVSPAPVNNGLNGWTLLALCDFIQDSVNKDHACIKIADDILSRHPATLEPLACLASRKGWFVVDQYICKGGETSMGFRPMGKEGFAHVVHAPTYAACEQLARTWLEEQKEGV